MTQIDIWEKKAQLRALLLEAEEVADKLYTAYDEEAKRLTTEIEDAFKDGNKDAWKHLHGNYDEAKRMKTMLYVSLQSIYDARARL